MTLKHALIAAAGLVLAASSARAGVPERALHVATSNAEVVDLASTPAVVLIANPQIADVVVEQGHLIFVIGKQPGQTRLFVYGADGKPVLERDVVVVPPRDRSVTIVRVTTATEYSCDPRCVSLGGPQGGASGGWADTSPATVPSTPAAPAPSTTPAPAPAAAPAPVASK